MDFKSRKLYTFVGLSLVLCFVILSCFANQGALAEFRFGCPVKKDRKAVCNVAPQCKKDKQCGNGEMCCTDVKCGGTRCIELVTKMGVCPGGVERKCRRTGVYRCGSDAECAGQQKCCVDSCGGSACKDPAGPPEVRIGCPLPQLNFPPSKCKRPIFECNQDGDCAQGQLCCPEKCASKVCKTVNVKAGDCSRKPLLTCPKPRVMECGSDDDCRNNFKCCEIECLGTRCKGPCVDDSSWRGSVSSCKRCSCKKLTENVYLLGKACKENISGVKEHCCKTCRDYYF